MFNLLKTQDSVEAPETLPEPQGEPQPLDRRKEPRKKVLIHAFASDRSGSVEIKCVIREISKGGCRIASSYISDLPRIIDILPEGFTKPLTGKIVWREAKVAGVEFLSASEIEEIKQAEPEPERAPEPVGFFNKLLSLTGLQRSAGLVSRGASARQNMLPRLSLRALHGVRQPLAALKGMIGLLLGDAIRPIPRRAKTILKNAHVNAEKAEKLVEEALHADKIDAGDLPCNPVPVDIALIASKSAVANAGFAARYDVRFEIKDSAGKSMVMADPNRIDEVMTNLLSTAAKYSPVGETITLSITRKDDKVRISVSDKGMGSNVTHGDADGKHGGQRDDDISDLGLDISRSVLMLHNAKLHLKSEPGEGTTAWFELPVINQSS